MVTIPFGIQFLKYTIWYDLSRKKTGTGLILRIIYQFSPERYS
jgi:hypothetical protein